MANRDRLTALDAGFLHLERSGAHMHVAGVLVFEGDPPAYDELVEAIEARMHLVPRYRQKLAHVPYGQGRPVWVDDPHFNARYHVRHSALPAPGSDEQLRNLAARLFALPLDRTKPLWELNLVEGLDGGRFAVISKTHHALVDGVSGVDITSVLFDLSPDATPPSAEGREWVPRPEPTDAELLAQALVERATVPAEGARGLRALTRAPRQALGQAGEWLVGVGAMAWAGLNPAPAVALQRADRPAPALHVGRLRGRALQGDQERAGRHAQRRRPLGGDARPRALPAPPRRRDRRARAQGDGPGVGARRYASAARWATAWRPCGRRCRSGSPIPRPFSRRSPRRCAGIKESGQAVGAVALTSLADFAPPTIMSQAARLQARQRFFNLVVTNVPGPQIPLYLLGRRMIRFYPVVPLAHHQALGIAIMSYDGRLAFGLLGDYDAMRRPRGPGRRPARGDRRAQPRRRASDEARTASRKRAPETASV